jgi:hypothetical protein
MGDEEDRRGKILTLDQASASGFATMTQKVPVAAVDQSGGRSDKGDDRGAQSRCLPRFGPNARLSVDGDGNLTISRVVGVSVGGLHHQAEPPTLIRRHSGVAPRGFPGQHVPEPENGFEPIRQILVKWQDDRRLRIGIGVGEDQILNAVSGVKDTICPLWSADGISKIDR